MVDTISSFVMPSSYVQTSYYHYTHDTSLLTHTQIIKLYCMYMISGTIPYSISILTRTPFPVGQFRREDRAVVQEKLQALQLAHMYPIHG